LSGLIDELIKTILQEQPTVGDFMTAPPVECPNRNQREIASHCSYQDL
jgi:hypothetical protein